MPPSPTPSASPPGTRERLIAAMASTLQRRGLHGAGLTELLAQAQAPKGVLYHHFPGGKSELAVAAIEATVQRITGSLRHLVVAQGGLLPALRAWLAGAQRQLERSAFELGCPLATVALESRKEDEAIRVALAHGFAAIRTELREALIGGGLPASKATNLATLCLAAYEGALMQVRVAGSAVPMDETAEALLGWVQFELEQQEATR